MQVSPHLNARLIDLGFMVLGGVIVWMATRQLGKSLDNSVNDATKSAGQVMAELNQWWNDSHDVEFTPILFYSHHFNDDYTLTDEARTILWKVPQNQSQLIKLFGEPDQPMKPEYRSLIKQSQ